MPRIRRLMAAARTHERVVIVSVATAMVMTGQGVAGPVLPIFASEFGVSVAAIGVTVGAFGLARLLFNVPLGLLSDRWGRRFLLVGGPLVVSVSMVGAAMAGGITSLTIWRFVAGVGSAMFMTGSLVYLVDISTLSNRARLIGFNQGALLVGQSLGPGIGGLIAEQFGIRAPFLFVAGATAAAALYGFFRLPETRPDADETRPTSETPASSPWRRLFTSKAFLAIALVNFSVFLTRATARNTLMPLAAVDVFGLSLGQVGGLLTAMAMVNLALLPSAASFADRHGKVLTIGPSMFGAAAALAVLALADGVAGFLVGAGILALATSLAGPAPAAFAADTIPPEIRGFSLGLFRTAGDLGLLIGPPALGLVADLGGYGWAFGVNAMVVALSTVVFLGVVWKWGGPAGAR